MNEGIEEELPREPHHYNSFFDILWGEDMWSRMVMATKGVVRITLFFYIGSSSHRPEAPLRDPLVIKDNGLVTLYMLNSGLDSFQRQTCVRSFPAQVTTVQLSRVFCDGDIVVSLSATPKGDFVQEKGWLLQQCISSKLQLNIEPQT